MAGAATGAAAASTSSPFPLPPPTTGNPRVRASSLTSSFPLRERRVNHLRRKIIKTLENKPYPDPSQTEFQRKTHTRSIEETLHQQHAESDQFSVSERTGFADGILGTFSTRSFAKIGLYLVGAFIFQTICAVLIFGSKDLFGEDDNLDSDDRKNEKKSKSKSSLLLSGNLIRSSMETKDDEIKLVDESQIDSKILEIQEMARQARQQEQLEGKRKGLVEDDDDVDYDSIDRTVKKKEIDDRLSKLRKSLEGDYQKPGPKISRKEGDVGNNVDHDSLMFKKKYKYKSPSINLEDKPKGFNGRKDVHVDNGSVINGISVDDSKLQIDKKNDTKTEAITGTSKESKYNQMSKDVKSGKASNLETKKPRGFGNESSETAVTEHDDFNKNDNLKIKKSWIKKSAKNLEDKSSIQTNFWWTSLPYVMAVKMQSGGNGEESAGLFILRNTSGLHHTVAFEDRSDATNFCYLLESFFEDLNNFSTTIIPIPTNELVDEVKSQKMKVIVVKKRQLKLYVGQPLEDVESALRALVEQQSE
ncbi:hypothetical protein R6Q59_022219 [Mikania micrantha]